MNLVRAVGTRVALLVLVLLATIGAWEMSKAALGRVEAQVPPTHYKCYPIRVVKAEEKIPKQVELTNQFGKEIVQVGKAQTLCVPTEKKVLG